MVVVGPDGCRLDVPGVARVVVRGGREVEVTPEPGARADELDLILRGPARGLLDWQRGRLVLHASAVTLPGGAALFLGGSGWGKSTTAAALRARGARVVEDDVSSLSRDGARWTVHSGDTRLKLHSDAAASAGLDPSRLPAISARGPKLGFSTGPGAAARVHRIYVLAEGDAVRVVPLRPAAAFLELVRHTYVLRVIPQEGAREHFEACGRLARDVSVRRLERPRRLDSLAAVAAAVCADA